MNRLFFILLIFSMAFIWVSCEDVIVVKLDEGETLLVVEAAINNDPAQKPFVKLSTTAPYFKNALSNAVSNAMVIMEAYDTLGNFVEADTLKEELPGSGYYTAPALKGKTHFNYTLIVEAMSEKYMAKTNIREMPPIDSIVFEYREQSFMYAEGYYGKYFGPELPGKGDYYRLVLFRDGIQMNEPQHLAYVSDDMVDGNYINDLEINFEPFLKNETIRVEMRSITKDEFYFLSELGAQVSNMGIFQNPPSNVRTNMINQNHKGKPAVGYFGGYGLSTVTQVVQ